MIRILTPVLIALLLITTPVTAKTLSKVAAVVNNEIVTTYQLESAVSSALDQMPNRNQMTAAQLDELKVQVLEKLIDDKLVEQRIKELGLDVSEPELSAAIEDVQRKNELTREALEQALAAQGLSMTKYREQIKKEILRYKLLGREINYKVLVTSGEVRDYFREHFDEYKVDPKVQVNRISYKIPANANEEQLANLHKQIAVSRDLLSNGEPFDKVLDAQKDIASGGDMGELVLTDLAEPLQQALAGLAPGEVSEAIEMNGQWHIFQVGDLNPGDITLFDRVKEEIEEILKREKTDIRFKEWEKELRTNAQVEIRI